MNNQVALYPRGGGGRGGEEYFLISQWECASDWGRIFTTGLTIVELHFQ